MAQVVKAHAWQSCLFQQGRKLFTKTTSVLIVSVAVTKHQTSIFPDCTSPQTRLHLAHMVLFQCLQDKSREENRPSTPRGFRLSFNIATSSQTVYCVTHLQGSLLKIDILPT